MASVVTGKIGDQEVDLKNAATESTLVAMLNLAKQDSAVLRELARKSGIDAKAIEKAQKAMEAQNQQGAAAGKNMKDAGNGASLLGGFLMDMGASVVQTGKNLFEFGDTLLEGKARASDLFKAFKDLPLGLGMLATLFQKVLQYQEKNLDTYKALSSSGVGLNTSLSGLRDRAFSMNLTLDEYAETMKKNADVMNRLGMSANKGSDNFVAINQQLAKNHKELYGLGYSYSQLNDLLPAYLRMSGDAVNLGRKNGDEQIRLQKAAALYGKELDFMARLTGESREQLEQKMQQEAAEASWQAHLAQMEPEQREKANQALIRANAMGGKGAMDAFKASIMGFAAPFSEEGRMFVSTMGGGTRALEEMKRIVLDNSKAENATGRLNDQMAKGLAANIKDLKGLQTVIGAMGQGGTEASRGLLEIQQKANAYIAQMGKNGMTEEQAIKKAIADVQKRQKADQDATAGAISAELAMKQLSQNIVRALGPAIERLAEVAQGLVVKFQKIVSDEGFLHKIDVAVKALANFIAQTFEDPQAVWNKIAGWFKSMLGKMFEAMTKSALGRWLFKELAVDLKQEGAIDTAKGVDMKEFADLAKKLKENKYANTPQGERAKKEDQERLTELTKDLKEGGNALIAKLRKQADETYTAATFSDPKFREYLSEQLAKKMGEQFTKADPGKQRQIMEQQQAYYTAGFTEMRKEQKAALEAQAKEIAGTTDAQKLYDLIRNNGNGTVKRAGGSIGSTGNLLENFGSGTSAVLHGNEAVVTERQLSNMAKGLQDAGSARAQEMLANAVNALNKQQAMTNQILTNIADYTRRTADSTPTRWGNAFARV